MSQVTEQSVRFQTALASIKLIQASAVLDLTEDDFDFLTSNKVWIATDRSRARRCVEACVYGTLDFVGYPRFPAPVEFIAAVIAYYVHPVNIQTACLIMEGAEFTENIINGVEDRKSGSAGMPRPISYAVFCLKKKNTVRLFPSGESYHLEQSSPLFRNRIVKSARLRSRPFGLVNTLSHRVRFRNLLVYGLSYVWADRRKEFANGN